MLRSPSAANLDSPRHGNSLFHFALGRNRVPAATLVCTSQPLMARGIVTSHSDGLSAGQADAGAAPLRWLQRAEYA
jgi:hypothetical protein